MEMDVEILNAKNIAEEEAFTNSLSSLVETLSNNNLFDGYGPQSGQVETLFYNNRWYLISNLRSLLSQIYVEHGIVQTLVDLPVDDAFRAGFEIKTSQLDADDIEQLLLYCERNQVITNVMEAIKWARLYGGGAILIITDQPPMTPLRLNAITPDNLLEFRAVDMWELYNNSTNPIGTMQEDGALGADNSDYYTYYGQQVHKSRVYKVVGKKAPSFIRTRLRGWGLSELEKLVTSLNSYMKNQDVIFDLLDEAKVDVYRMEGFNNSLLQKDGTTAVAKRVQMANRLKSFNNALMMDAKDEYEQKQIAFTGLAEVLLQIRQGIAADLRMPMTKLFGISAAGFNSGEDDIENYNAMIEGEIRAKTKFILVDVLNICCRKVFGFMPDDLMVTFNPLRILNAKEEEEVKDSQFNRVTNAFSLGLATAQEAKEALNKDSLLGVEVDETTDALPPLAANPIGGNDNVKSAKGGAGKQSPTQA